MTTLDHVVATHQSEWVSFSEEPLVPVSSEGGTEEHLTRLSSSSDQSEGSSGENRALDGGSQDLSHSEQDDSSEKTGLISEAASPPGSPDQPKPDLALAISTWVQFEEDTPWTSPSSPPKETALPLAMPCWTCPSFNSLKRCPLTSESSWTTHSEDTSSPSLGPLYTDLQLTNAEELTSSRASGADSTASGHPHCFFCHLELGSDREVPSRFANHVTVEFSMPTTSASKAAVRSISVEDKTDVRKWVNYSSHYSYKVEIEQKKSLKPDSDGNEMENPKECGVQ